MDPTYPQATTLHAWAKTIQPLLIEYTAKSTSTNGSLLFVPFEEESTHISDIQMQPPGQIFYINGQLTLTNEDQHFYSMACSDCKTPFTRSISSRPIYCIQCDRSTMLIPRVQFDITITDETGSITAFVSYQTAEKMLHLPVEEIYKICQAKKQSWLLEQLCNNLGTTTYKVQMKKLFSRYRATSTPKLALLNYERKHNVIQPTPMTTAEATKRKIPATNSKGSSSKLKTVITSPVKRD